MFLALNKKSIWFIVIWFAVLQAVSPFIHGHLEADSPAQGYGLHIHMQELTQANAQSYNKTHTLQSVDAHMHTVGVDNALVKSLDLLPSPSFAMLFVLFLFALTTRFISASVSQVPHQPLYLRSQSKPRAPPFP